MFNSQFFPTPAEVIELMIGGYNLQGATILEPSAGAGHLVTALQNAGAEVIACENDPRLKILTESKCKLIAGDFLTVTPELISHIDYIIMNPPFNADEKHIIHAYEIAPESCQIIALCNLSTVKNTYSKERQKLRQIIDENGSFEDIGEAFTTAERSTAVKVALIRIRKPGNSATGDEYTGFYLEDEPEETGSYGIMNYNAVRDLVNRYVGACKIYDKQVEQAVLMNQLTAGYFKTSLGMSITKEGAPLSKNEFKKEMQKAGWYWIFEKMDIEKTMTQGLKDDINKFVEKQTSIPFTMKNIYAMLQIVHGTTGARMDKAILEVFEKITSHDKDNRLNLEGWKTNSAYLVNRKFIVPRLCEQDKYNKGKEAIQTTYSGNFNQIEDLVKALCYITGDNWENFGELREFINYPYKVYHSGKVESFRDDIHYGGSNSRADELRKQGIEYTTEHIKCIYGELFQWSYFTIRAYKKGTMHFEFTDEKVWSAFNQRVAKLKGYPLPEKTNKTKQEQKTRTATQPANTYTTLAS